MPKEMTVVSAAAKEPADALDVYRTLLVHLCMASGGSVLIPKPNLDAAENAMYRITISPVDDGVLLSLEKADRH